MKKIILVLSLITVSVFAKVNSLTKNFSTKEINKIPKEPTSPTETPKGN